MSRLDDKKTEGLVFNIQKYSVHDGPGIRTIVFLKGCRLRCRWCSNPESQRLEPQLAVNANRCIGLQHCTRCIDACPRGALKALPEGQLAVDRSQCAGCAFPCAEACPAEGLLVYGKTRTVDEVLKIVEQDAPFYARSGGGMTLSGGEPFLQAKFALALLREARARYVRTAVETCGEAETETVLEAGQWLNYVLFDVKHMDSAVHQKFTGRPNERILANLKALTREYPQLPVLVRTPVVPGFNDSEEAVRAIAEFVAGFGPQVEYEMLPYHRLGTQKYLFLGRTYHMGDVSLETKRFNALQKAASQILGSRQRIAK